MAVDLLSIPVLLTIVMAIATALAGLLFFWRQTGKLVHEATPGSEPRIGFTNDPGDMEIFLCSSYEPTTGIRKMVNGSGQEFETKFWPPNVLIPNAGLTAGDTNTGMYLTTVDPFSGKVCRPASFSSVVAAADRGMLIALNEQLVMERNEALNRPLDAYGRIAQEMGQMAKQMRGNFGDQQFQQFGSPYQKRGPSYQQSGGEEGGDNN